jgi:hypothetical protein
MKKYIALLASLLITTCICAHEHGWTCMVKQGYFVPQEKALRDMFSCCGSKGGYFIEGAARYNVWDYLYLELNASYFGKKGRALVTTLTGTDDCNTTCTCGECIKFKLPTIGLGLKYFYYFRDYASFFVGGGIKGFFARITQDSLCAPCRDNANTAGGFIHAGLLFDVYKGLNIELFADYLGARLKCPCTDANTIAYKLNVGGFAGGLGIGYSF